MSKVNQDLRAVPVVSGFLRAVRLERSKQKSDGTRVTKIAEKNAPPRPDASGQSLILVIGYVIFLFLGAVLNGFVGLIFSGLIGVIALPIAVFFLAFQKPSDEQIDATGEIRKAVVLQQVQFALPMGAGLVTRVIARLYFLDIPLFSAYPQCCSL